MAANAETRVTRGTIEREAVVHCRTPAWMRLGMRAVFLAAGLALGYLVLDSGALPSDAPLPLRAVLVLASAGLVVLALLPRLRRSSWTQFFASNDGLYLPDSSLPDERTPWLFVPWSNVVEIRVEPLRGQRSSVLFELHLSEAEIERHFHRYRRKLEFFRQAAPPECFPVGFSSAFLDAPRAARELQRLRDAATSGDPAPPA